VVALFLAREAKGLLIGERADPGLIAEVRAMLEAEPAITHVNHVRTVHTAPERVFVAISADFADTLKMGEAETLIERMERAIKTRLPTVTSIYIRPEKREDAVDAAAIG
jgi:divalent metal cation (Fe/Co/Zn/Cd) transporter